MLSGLSIAGVVYIVVAIVAAALVPIGDLKATDTPLVVVVHTGVPGLPIKDIVPFISMVAVSNSALINMLMASRLIYGMSRQQVLPPVLGAVSPNRRSPWAAILLTTAIAFGLILYVTAFANADAIEVLGGTTSLLLLAVFAMVNVAVLVLRRDTRAAGRHFTTPTPPAGHRLRGVAVSGDTADRAAGPAVPARRDLDPERRGPGHADHAGQSPVGNRWGGHHRACKTRCGTGLIAGVYA